MKIRLICPLHEVREPDWNGPVKETTWDPAKEPADWLWIPAAA